MQNGSRNLIVIVAVVLAAAFGFNHLTHDARFTPPQQTQGEAPSSAIIWSHGPDGSVRNAQEHWQKHGREFPQYRTAREYETGALAFVTSPPPGTLTKTDERGDTLFYDPATNTFAVRDAAGEPRTFFKPDNGRAYWDRQ